MVRPVLVRRCLRELWRRVVDRMAKASVSRSLWLFTVSVLTKRVSVFHAEGCGLLVEVGW